MTIETTKETEQQMVRLDGQCREGTLESATGAFFRRIDWWAFWVVSLVAGAVYFFTLAPTVTLEDSGELAVASDWLGVPHPPGYPIWTLVTWFFQWVFHWVQYNGHPNPAWGVGLASAVSGAFACGLLALLVSRSGADLLRSLPEGLGGKLGKAEEGICLVAGVSGGLLLAFSPVLWSQSVIVEVYSLNALFQMAILLLIYMWMCRPKNDGLLWAAAFLFGLGLTNHQTLLFLGAGLAVAVLMKDTDLFRDFAVAAVLIGIPFVLAAKGVQLFANPDALAEQLRMGPEQMQRFAFDDRLWKWSVGPDTPQFWLYNYLFLAIPVSLWVGKATARFEWRRRLAIGAGVVLGLLLLVHIGHSVCASEGAKAAEGYSANLFSLVPPASERGTPFAQWLWTAGPGVGAMAFLTLFCAVPLGLAMTKLPHARTVAVSILLAELGVAFYLYLPLASDQNPPMNWGYARTWEGFMHAVTRGQYEAIVPTDIFSDKFVMQLGSYLTDLRGQFTLPVAVIGFLPFCAWGFRAGGRRWSVFPAALVLVLAASALIVLETLGWSGAEAVYRLLIAPVLLAAGWGGCLLLALYLKRVAKAFRSYPTSTKLMVGAFGAAVLAGVLWMDALSLRAVYPSAEAIAKAAAEGRSLGLSGAAKGFYLALVFGPPAAVLLAGLLSVKAGMDFDLGEGQQGWLIASVVGFFSVSVVFLIFQNPSLDIQQLFIGRVQFIQSHALYALWLGYGMLLSVVCLGRWGGGAARKAALAVALLLPGVLLWQNAYDEEQVRIVGGAEQNGHSYGWQFGNWGLEGVKGIKEDFACWYGGEDSDEYKAQWGAFCEAMGSDDPQYPPPMTQGAVFYGGTDPGRFVPTYMIYSADVRSDVYLITQNALADNTFMNITRDLYGDTIYIPSVEDSNAAFQKYVEDVQSGRIQAGADIKFENGRVSVQGVGGVMTINGLLAELIFKENKFRHDFYVEESYVIQWMYPYLTPNGLMLKLNRDPLPALPEQVVKDDHAFWGWYTPWLLGQSEFRRDICARKSFSKLRSAIAGIYEYRRMYDEAEYAYKQAVEMYPLSPEAIFRLAQMYMKIQRYADAETLLADFAKEDPHNESAAGFLSQIRSTQSLLARRGELESRQAAGETLSIEDQMELVEIYRMGGQSPQYLRLASRLLDDPDTPVEAILALAGLFAQDQRVDAMAYALETAARRDPRRPDIWINLAASYAWMNRTDDALRCVRQALSTGGAQARDAILQDSRFQPLADNREFRTLLLGTRPTLPGAPTSAPRPTLPGTLPNLPGLAK
jgi:tetratricopeptide (TPR) repeat protein